MNLIKKPLLNHAVIAGFSIALLSGCSVSASSADTSNDLVREGDQASAGGDPMAAIVYYQHAVKVNSDNADAWDKFANATAATGNSKGSLEKFADGLDHVPNDLTLLRDYGRALLKAGKPEAARDEYQKALDINASDPKALNGLGISLDYLGQHNAAQQAYEGALSEKPNDLITLNNLAHSYVLAGDYDRAIKLLEPHVDDADATSVLRQNLAEAYGLNDMETDANRLGLKDLPPADVERNLAFYRAERRRLALAPPFYAALGFFPTAGMVDARMGALKENFSDEVDGLIVENVTQTEAIGGTPSFSLRVRGFASVAKLRSFCQKLEQKQVNCQPVVRN